MWVLHQESRKELDESCEEDPEVIFHEIDVKLKEAAIFVERQQEEKVHFRCISTHGVPMMLCVLSHLLV